MTRSKTALAAHTTMRHFVVKRTDARRNDQTCNEIQELRLTEVLAMKIGSLGSIGGASDWV
mgnify:CR=1 FL=1